MIQWKQDLPVSIPAYPVSQIGHNIFSQDKDTLLDT